MYRLKIVNGRIFDGERFNEGGLYIEDGRIAEIGELSGRKADYTFDAAGDIVSAGLVDMHVHFEGISPDIYGISADAACLPDGVTAAAECGAEKGNKAFSDAMKVKNVIFAITDIRKDKAVLTRTKKVLSAYRDKAVGVKVYYDTGGWDIRSIDPLQEIVDFAKEKGLKTCVHSTHTPVPMVKIVETLSPGDILTHIYHGYEHPVDEDDFAAFRLAKEKGVILDAGHAGEVHTNFALFRKAVERGFLPDTISTDITCLSAYLRGGYYGLPMAMSFYRTLGVPEEMIWKAVTVTPGEVLHQKDWGQLYAGGPADIAVLHRGKRPYALTDAAGNTLKDSFSYFCRLTVMNGQVLFKR